MAFYKLDEGQLFEAPTAVESLHYAIYVERKDEYEYPVYGWYWFDTKEDALVFFDLPSEA